MISLKISALDCTIRSGMVKFIYPGQRRGYMKQTKTGDEVFRSMPVPQAVRTMAMPAVISQLIVLIYNLADTYFIGQTNNPTMVAGVSLILPVFNLTLAFGGLFGIGGGALIPKLLAQNDNDEAGRVAADCVRLGALVALAFSVILLLFMRPILFALGASDATLAHARIYVLMVLVIGGIPTVLNNILSNLIRSLGLSREAGIAVALGGVLNIFLDPLFMFVLLPRGNEVLGVGIATLLSNIISCIYCLVIYFKKQSVIRSGFTLPAPRADSRRAVITVGVPGSVGTLLFDIDYMVLDKLVAAYGDTALAAIGIVLKAERFPQQVGIGLCQGMVPLVAYSYAIGDYPRIRKIMAATLKAGLTVALVSVTIYELFTKQIIWLFIRDAETIAIGTGFLRVRSIAAVIMFFCFFVVFLYQGLGDGKRSLLLAVLRWACLNIPMLFLLNHILGMYGLVWAQVISDVLTVIISYAILHHSMKGWPVSAGKELP